MIKAKTLKGFRDFLPKEAKKRQYAINTLKKVFESYGFEPLETPSLEYEEILLGKYGDEGDKLMYRFEDNGKRRVALRYDQTVPLARVVAQYLPAGRQGQNELPMPFKRYQIQNVWRAENTQKGRFREFTQCDIDTVGINSALADAEIIEVAAASLKKLGFNDFKIWINDRNAFKKLERVSIAQNKKFMIALDKYKKIGKEAVIKEIEEIGFSNEEASALFEQAESTKETQWLTQVKNYLKKLGFDDKTVKFSSVLARGLDYYTSTIFEIEIEGYSGGSVCGGGRYDNLIGMFAGKQISAVGCAFGFDRLMEVMEELNLFPADLTTTKVLVTIFSPELRQKSLDCTSALRSTEVSAELYLDENAKLEKQLKYADQKGIPFAIIIGPEEVKNNTVTLKNLKTREQKAVNLNQLSKLIDI